MTTTSSAVKNSSNNFLPPGLVSNLQEVLLKRKGADDPDPQSQSSSAAKPPTVNDESAEPSSSSASNSGRVDDQPDSDTSKPVILVTNGDGIESPGLTHLVQALVCLGRYNVHVCAPQSSVCLSLIWILDFPFPGDAFMKMWKLKFLC